MAYDRAGVQEFIAKKDYTTTNGDVDIWLGGRHQSAELYIKNTHGSGAATVNIKMIPPVIEGVTMTTEHDLPAAIPADTMAAGAENLYFFQSLVSGVRVVVTSNTGSLDMVVRLVGRTG